jgi:hypothetical protein
MEPKTAIGKIRKVASGDGRKKPDTDMKKEVNKVMEETGKNIEEAFSSI